MSDKAFIVGQLRIDDPTCIRLVSIGVFSSGARDLTSLNMGEYMNVDLYAIPGDNYHEATERAVEFIAQHFQLAGMLHLMDERLRQRVRTAQRNGKVPPVGPQKDDAAFYGDDEEDGSDMYDADDVYKWLHYSETGEPIE